LASSINERLKQFFSELTTDPVEERVIEYVIREVHNGRSLMDVMDDPFVRNRLSDTKRDEVLENSAVIEALEEEIRAAFQAPDIGFSH
jgi:hypothetical protein